MSTNGKSVTIDPSKPRDANIRDRMQILANQIQVQGSQLQGCTSPMQLQSPHSPSAARRPRTSLNMQFALGPSSPQQLGMTPPAKPRKKTASGHLIHTHRRAVSGGSLNMLGITPGLTGLSSSDASPDGSSISGSSSSLDQQIDEQKRYTRYLSINGHRYRANVEDMDKLGQIGHGATGSVLKMLHRPSKKLMACKVMMRSANEDEQKRVLMDLFVMINHNCPYIVESYGSIISQQDVYICMELMSTCLGNLMKKYRRPVPEPIVGRVAVCVVHALDYLKETHEFIHRDIKPSNILLDAESGRFKICDFGISGRLVNSKARTRGAGCAAYMAPERFMPDTASQYDIRADVWSMGITLVELALGEYPYRGVQNEFEVLSRIVDDEPPKLPRDQGFSLDFQSFISQCLMKERENRPKFRELKHHAFIKRYESTPVDVRGWYQGLSGAAPS
ncbi:dual specificity mitogen-activated protein kinase kinase 7-like [Sycon ciliatum]|uniref:dual specificity mitogen-activated protein kinase kinase 7-like n=1 Tax=Sycon ciliatum TaxID=27933 RepID=UPI0020AA1697|eukprot:scpid59699/ scgid32108/ Dual specificity mitogen-activated protein kinase kinase 7; JNK-activating kinase 2; MAPK/ERK kinase 7; Stress-activated protein kinase kinase 4; c-Jun N-terminal kinase kinase 2